MYSFIHAANSAKQNGRRKGWIKPSGECEISCIKMISLTETWTKMPRGTGKDDKEETLFVMMEYVIPCSF